MGAVFVFGVVVFVPPVTFQGLRPWHQHLPAQHPPAAKAINDEIKTLEKYKLKVGESKEKKIWYDTEFLEISEVQRRIGDDISKLERQRDNLK